VIDISMFMFVHAWKKEEVLGLGRFIVTSTIQVRKCPKLHSHQQWLGSRSRYMYACKYHAKPNLMSHYPA
jgi:hypothetical protein